MSAEDRAVFYKILDKHVDELWLPDEYSAKQQRELLDTVARKIVEALSSEGLAVVAREDTLSPQESVWLKNRLFPRTANSYDALTATRIWRKLSRLSPSTGEQDG